MNDKAAETNSWAGLSKQEKTIENGLKRAAAKRKRDDKAVEHKNRMQRNEDIVNGVIHNDQDVEDDDEMGNYDENSDLDV